MRYMWDRFDDYFPRTKPLMRAAAAAFRPSLQRWDRETSGGVTQFVANSRFVRDRIGRYYGRDAEIVHPYVDDAFLEAPLPEERSDEHVMVSALVPYKKGGAGHRGVGGQEAGHHRHRPLLAKLQARAPSSVTFLGYVSRDKIIERLARARSLILPGVEDFGITPLESMALARRSWPCAREACSTRS